MAKKKRTAIIFIFIGFIFLSGATFTIDEKEQAIITQLGKYIRTIKEPGLYFKVPVIQTLHLFDKRILVHDPSAVEYITLDKKRVMVDPVSRWKIEDPLEFFMSVRTEAGGVARLGGILSARSREGGAHTAL